MLAAQLIVNGLALGDFRKLLLSAMRISAKAEASGLLVILTTCCAIPRFICTWSNGGIEGRISCTNGRTDGESEEGAEPNHGGEGEVTHCDFFRFCEWKMGTYGSWGSFIIATAIFLIAGDGASNQHEPQTNRIRLFLGCEVSILLSKHELAV